MDHPAAPRSDRLEAAATPLVWRAPEGPEGLAAVPVGGGRARAGLEIDHSEPQARVWRSRGRAAAHRHTQRPGPKAAQRSARNISGAASTTGARADRPLLSAAAGLRASRVVDETRHVALEEGGDGRGRARAVLGDDDVGFAGAVFLVVVVGAV